MGHKQSDATEHALIIIVRPTSRSGRIGEWGVGLNFKGQWAERYPQVPECSLVHTASPAERLPPPLGGSGAGLHVHWWAPWYQLPEAEKGWPVDGHLLPVRSGTPRSVPVGKGSEKPTLRSKLLLHPSHCCRCYQDGLLQPAASEPCLSPWKKQEAKRSQPILRENERRATGSSAPAFAGEKRCDGCMYVASKEECGLTGFAPHTSSRGTRRTMQMCKSAQWKQKLSSDSKTFQLWSYYLATGHEETGAVSKVLLLVLMEKWRLPKYSSTWT